MLHHLLSMLSPDGTPFSPPCCLLVVHLFSSVLSLDGTHSPLCAASWLSHPLPTMFYLDGTNSPLHVASLWHTFFPSILPLLDTPSPLYVVSWCHTFFPLCCLLIVNLLLSMLPLNDTSFPLFVTFCWHTLLPCVLPRSVIPSLLYVSSWWYTFPSSGRSLLSPALSHPVKLLHDPQLPPSIKVGIDKGWESKPSIQTYNLQLYYSISAGCFLLPRIPCFDIIDEIDTCRILLQCLPYPREETE